MIMDAKPALGAVLQHGMPVEVGRERVVLAFPTGSFFGRQAEALDAKRAIADVAERVMGGRPGVEVTYGEDTGAGTMKPLVQVEKERREARVEATREKALSHPLVLEAAQVFAISRESMTVRVELE
jgi:DNA polymerase-3 subunit gamma/tau